MRHQFLYRSARRGGGCLVTVGKKEGLGLGLDLAAALIPGEGLIAAGAHAVIDVASTSNAATDRDAAGAFGSVVSFQVGALEQAVKVTSWGAVQAIPAFGQFFSGALAFYDIAKGGARILRLRYRGSLNPRIWPELQGRA